MQPQADPYRTHMLLGKIVLGIFFVCFGYFACWPQTRWDPPHPNGTPQRLNDFTAYYSAGELARRGENIYDYQKSSTPGRSYIYPPMFAVFPMAPLSLLPHDAAAALYYVLNVAMLLATLWLLRKLLWPPQQEALALPFWRRPEVGLFLSMAVCWRFLHSNMVLGNANGYILLLLAWALYLTARKRPFGSGLAIALATAFKVTPGIFGLYFFWNRRAMAMAGGTVGLVLFMVVVPSFLLGFSNNWRNLSAWTEFVEGKAEGVQGAEALGIHAQKKDEKREASIMTDGISFQGTLLRLLAPAEKATDSHNIASLGRATILRIAKVFSLLLLILTIALTFPAWTGTGEFPAALSWGLVSATMLLISPITRPAHLVVLLIPFAALIALLQQGKLQGYSKKLAWASLLLLGPAGSILSSANVIGRRASITLNAAGFATFAMVLLYAACAVALWSLKEKSKSHEPFEPVNNPTNQLPISNTIIASPK